MSFHAPADGLHRLSIDATATSGAQHAPDKAPVQARGHYRFGDGALRERLYRCGWARYRRAMLPLGFLRTRKQAAKQSLINGSCITRIGARFAKPCRFFASLSRPFKACRLLPPLQAVRQVCACRSSYAGAWRESAKRIREQATKQRFIKGFCATQMNARPASRVVSPVSLSKPTKVHRLLPLPQAIRQVCACRSSYAGT